MYYIIRKIFILEKLDIDEIVAMFLENNIPVTSKDLIKLFFKNKTQKKEKHKVVFLTEDDYFLDFNQLVNFATNIENEEKFTEFMRNIKKKVSVSTNRDLKTMNSIDSKEMMKEKTATILNDTTSNYCTQNINKNFNNNTKLKIIEEEEKVNKQEVIYLPMSFNKILEYFNNKGKIRSNINKIKSTIVSYYIRRIN
jgi:hypothetical protein